MPVLPVNHPIRLEALGETHLLDSLPEESYDRFTRLACSILGVEISLISLVDRHRQYFKSEQGLGEPLRTTRQNDISYSFCRFVVEGGAPFVVENAFQDPRVSENPAVTEMGIAAYLGIPIHTPDGCILGSLCAVQMEPRKWSENDMRNLSDLAGAVCREVELSEQAATMRDAFRILESRWELQEKDLRETVHDLRTPAGAISSCMDLLTMGDDEFSEEAQELIGLTQTSAHALLDMLQQILMRDRQKESNDPSLHAQPTSASLLLRRVARVVRPFANEAKVKLELEWPDELIQLKADERLIERVLLNLLTNAVKYSPEGGIIHIRLERGVESEGNQCLITVTDQGPGVPDAE